VKLPSWKIGSKERRCESIANLQLRSQNNIPHPWNETIAKTLQQDGQKPALAHGFAYRSALAAWGTYNGKPWRPSPSHVARQRWICSARNAVRKTVLALEVSAAVIIEPE
jgi:hypothetical protein